MTIQREDESNAYGQALDEVLDAAQAGKVLVTRNGRPSSVAGILETHRVAPQRRSVDSAEHA